MSLYRVDHVIQAEGNPPATVNLYTKANPLHVVSAIAGALEEDEWHANNEWPFPMPRTLSITITLVED